MRSRRTGIAAICGGVTLAALALSPTPLTSARPPAAEATTTVTPVADTYVADNAKSVNFGTRTLVGVDAYEVKRTFIRFTVSGITDPITSVKLRLHVADTPSASSNNGGTWRLMSNTSWSEGLVTWNNQPAIDGNLLGTLGQVPRNTWVELDLTGRITGDGTYSIGGTSTSTNGADYDSRETGSTAPTLVITTGPPPPPPPPPPPQDPVLVGAGDIASPGTGDTQTAALVSALPAATVFTAGDNIAGDGSAIQYSTYYEPTWGAFKSRTHPAPGNHDYLTPGAAPYYSYFGALAGPAGLGYYSYDLGSWHIVSLNTQISMAVGSAQETWLRNDLAANPRQCTLAYWHRPLFTSSAVHGPSPGTRPLFQALYDYGAEVVVNGHTHQYERFAPMNPSGVRDVALGVREFVVGTGGTSHYAFGTIQPNSEARDNTAYGVLAFTLHSNTYEWEFIPVAGQTYTDRGTTACH